MYLGSPERLFVLSFLTTTSSSMNNTDMKKPMRPLTAYHIFFQIEREYIIQTTPGSDADKSIHNNKSYLTDVPRKYRKVKLLPDWYAGPGKRKKRKHRKSHGKIGFLELSRVISKRWATLDTSDPETKQYVRMIAARELDDYKMEMNEWKELNGEEIEEGKDKVAAAPAPKKQRAKSKRSVGRPRKSSVSISPSQFDGSGGQLVVSLRNLITHPAALGFLDDTSTNTSCTAQMDNNGKSSSIDPELLDAALGLTCLHRGSSSNSDSSPIPQWQR